MNMNRPDMTEDVKYRDYTNKSLQTDSISTTMKVVTQTNAVKSPTDSPAATKLVYTVEEIARMLAISLRSAYNLCNSTTEFRVLRVGGSIRRAGTGERRVNCHTSGSGFVRPGDSLGTPALAGQRRDILRLCLAFWHLFNSVANHNPA